MLSLCGKLLGFLTVFCDALIFKSSFNFLAMIYVTVKNTNGFRMSKRFESPSKMSNTMMEMSNCNKSNISVVNSRSIYNKQCSAR